MPDRRGVTVAAARRLILRFPSTEEGRSFDATVFLVRRIVLARFRDNDTVLVVKCGDDERDIRIQSDPTAFFITDEYRGHPAVLVRLDSVMPKQLHDVLEVAWLRIASSRLRASYLVAKRPRKPRS